jgi:thermostable 8-oxoguanine DNA glycosylase
VANNSGHNQTMAQHHLKSTITKKRENPIHSAPKTNRHQFYRKKLNFFQPKNSSSQKTKIGKKKSFVQKKKKKKNAGKQLLRYEQTKIYTVRF